MGFHRGRQSEGVPRALRRMPRRAAPDVPLEAILDRFQERRRRILVLVGVFLAALVVAGLLFPRDKPEIPIHLELRIVDTTAPADGAELAPAAAEAYLLDGMPRELQGP